MPVLVNGRPGGHRVLVHPAPDGIPIHYRAWQRPDPPAALLCLHGQGDHSGCLAAMADQLWDLGLAVYAPDQRGFGLSPAPRGDIDSYGRFIADALAMFHQVAAGHPGVPVFLVGLSMGGHVAFRAAARLGDRAGGVVALSPGFGLRRTPLGLAARCLWLAFTRPGAYLPTVTAAAPTTRNREHQAAVAADPGHVGRFTARFYRATVVSLLLARLEMPRVRCPVLVLQGGEDHLTCSRTAHRYFQRLRVPDRQFRLLPGLYHNLSVEPEMPTVAREVAAWVLRRAAPYPVPLPGRRQLTLGGPVV